MTADFTTLNYRKLGHVVRIGLNRAEKRNAFNLAMLRELGLAYQRYEDDADARCAILYAEGDHFTAGLDLAEVGPAVQQGARLFPEGALDPLDLHEPRRSKPLICAVQGWCLTIGVELLLAADIRVAAEGTRFSQLEIKRGIMPFGGATLRFPQICGWGNAMRYLLTADEFDAATAYRIGLVQEVAAPGQQVETAMAIAERIAKQAPLAVRETILSSRLAVESGFAAANAELLAQARRLMASEDAKEGVMSFIQRREATFQGK